MFLHYLFHCFPHHISFVRHILQCDMAMHVPITCLILQHALPHGCALSESQTHAAGTEEALLQVQV